MNEENQIGAGSENAAANFLTADQILGADDRVFEDHFIPEWKGHVRIVGMSASERDAWEDSLVDVKRGKRILKEKNVRASLAIRVLVDPRTGERLFKSSKQIVALGQKSARALNFIFDVAQRLSGVTDEAVKEIEGNSDEAAGED